MSTFLEDGVEAMEPVDAAAGADRIGTIDETPVLVVEDHSLVAEGLVFALVQEGMPAAAVSWRDVDDLLERLGIGPGLVLLDLDLGAGITGEHLVGPLAERGFTVVVLTAVTDPIRLGTCLDAGAVAVAEKSDSFDDVLDVVRRALAGEPAMGARLREELLDELRRHRAATGRRLEPFTKLTPREQELLAWLLHGRQAADIAAASGISLKTVRAHTSSLLQKLGVHSQLAAVALAREAGWAANSSIVPMR